MHKCAFSRQLRAKFDFLYLIADAKVFFCYQQFDNNMSNKLKMISNDNYYKDNRPKEIFEAAKNKSFNILLKE